MVTAVFGSFSNFFPFLLSLVLHVFPVSPFPVPNQLELPCQQTTGGPIGNQSGGGAMLNNENPI